MNPHPMNTSSTTEAQKASADLDAIATEIARDIAQGLPYRSQAGRIGPDLATGYAVQDRVVARLLADGTRRALAGYKVAMNAPALMAHMGVTEPLSARLFSDQRCDNGADLSGRRFHQFAFEPEIAALVVRDLPPGATPWDRASVAACVGRLVPALELLDARRRRAIAQAYAGHQFGGFSPQLGDGRALLLGEVIDRHGSAATSPQGLGPHAVLARRRRQGRWGPMLREYLIGEAMHALGIPTTRALAVVATGETVLARDAAARRGADPRRRQPHPRRHLPVLRRARRGRPRCASWPTTPSPATTPSLAGARSPTWPARGGVIRAPGAADRAMDAWASSTA
jgi:hypothetical protein